MLSRDASRKIHRKIADLEAIYVRIIRRTEARYGADAKRVREDMTFIIEETGEPQDRGDVRGAARPVRRGTCSSIRRSVWSGRNSRTSGLR